MTESPLAQRLIIYKFVVLDIFHDPFPFQEHLSPTCFWLGPQKPPPYSWLKTIGERRHGTVGITCSLAQAIKTRKRNPCLPIVLVRPLFSPMAIPNTGKFRLLASPFLGLSKSDPFLPIQWGYRKKGLPCIQLHYENHPKMLILRRLNLGESVLWPDEVGTLYTQETIGRETRPIKKRVFRESTIFLRNTYEQLKSCSPSSIWAVCSRRQIHLDWFQRDVLNLFGLKAVCRKGCDKAIHPTRCVQFFLFHDKGILWQAPDSEVVQRINGIIELDYWPGSYVFRCYRLQIVGPQHLAGYITDRTCEGWAEIQMGRHSLHFECHRGQWFSAMTDEIRGVNKTHSYYRRLRVFELIAQTIQARQ